MLDKLKNLTLLCVEDNEGVRKRLAKTLKFYFKEVILAEDGLEGFDKYKNSKVDIILTDIDMPNMNGVELCKNIRKIDKNIPLIVLSAYSSEEYLLELINLNINHFILKPINSIKLETALKGIFSENIEHIVINDELSIDFNLMCIVEKEINTRIINREKLFLKLLYKNHKKKRITTYQEIQDIVWQNDIMSQSALKTFIKVLRKKFSQEIIENISQIGYKFCNF
jgi:DNA-binding response OmpR family regulator